LHRLVVRVVENDATPLPYAIPIPEAPHAPPETVAKPNEPFDISPFEDPLL
jgi:hypothetical protein